MENMPDGVLAMLVTPMDDDETISHEKLRKEVDWCAEQGASGIVVTPSIGEFACLTNEERWKCFETCMDQVTSRWPGLFTVATIAATTSRECIQHAKVAKEMGYDAAQLIPPYYWLPDEEEVYRHYQLVAQVELPIVVYHNPALSKFYMRREFLGKLARIPGVIAIKEVRTDRHVELEPLFKAVDDQAKIYTTFRVFTTGLVLGSNGGFINVFALPLCIEMWKLFHQGKREAMEEVQNMVNELFPRGGEDNKKHIGNTKMAASVVTGIPMGSPRAPYMLPEAKYEKALRDKLSPLALGKRAVKVPSDS